MKVIDTLDTYKKKMFWLTHIISYIRRSGAVLTKRQEEKLRTDVYKNNTYLVIVDEENNIKIVNGSII